MAVSLFRLGAMAFDLVTTPIPLWAATAGATNVTSLRKQGTTVGYQVTAAKTLYIVNMVVGTADVTAGVGGFALGYADNDVGFNTLTARVNPVPLVGSTEGNFTVDIGFPVDPGKVNQQLREYPYIYGPVPAGKFIIMQQKISAVEMLLQAWAVEV